MTLSAPNAVSAMECAPAPAPMATIASTPIQLAVRTWARRACWSGGRASTATAPSVRFSNSLVMQVRCDDRCIHPAAVASARRLLETADTYVELAMLYAALADPTRARIVHLLLQQEMCTCDLALVLGVSDSAVSQHLRPLRNLRLVRWRRAGKIVYYSLDDSHVAQVVQVGLAHLGHIDAAERLAGLVAAS